jgi:hypothetical protein
MKKFIFAFVTMLALIAPKVFDQKVAYVDLDYILNNIPEYKSA